MKQLKELNFKLKAIKSFGKIWDVYWIPLDKDIYLHYSIDITDRHKASEELNKYAHTQEILLREINHRVKNNLYAITGMLNKGKNKLTKKNTLKQAGFIEDIITRINSLSTVHSLLSKSKWQPINLTELCINLTEHITDSIILDKSIIVNIKPSKVTVSSNQANHIALVINEIVTNAAKHALPLNENLMIKFEIESDDENIFVKIRDNGGGFPQPLLEGDFKNIGVGFELIFGIVKESMGGSVAIENDNGAVFNITIKNEGK